MKKWGKLKKRDYVVRISKRILEEESACKKNSG